MINSSTGEKLYSIGEVAKTLHISTQTIRYYDRKGIIKPKFINPHTGYRYYNWQQFRILNDIKFMQFLGFNLHDIDFIVKNNDIPYMLQKLNDLKIDYSTKIEEIKNKIDTINWFSNYCHESISEVQYISYVKNIHARNILSVKVDENETAGSFTVKLEQIRNNIDANKFHIRHMYTYIVDLKKFMNGIWAPKEFGVYVTPPPVAILPIN